MPVPEIAALNANSSPEQIKAAVSACIATEVQSGRPQDQALAMCYSMARAKTGNQSIQEPGANQPADQSAPQQAPPQGQ